MQFTGRERERISLEATVWLLLLSEHPFELYRSKFVTWLGKSPLHLDVFLSMVDRFPETSCAPVVSEAAGRHAAIDYKRSVWAPACLCAVTFLLACIGWVTLKAPANAAYWQHVYSAAGTYALGRDSEMTLDPGAVAAVHRASNGAKTRVRLIQGHANFAGKHGFGSGLDVTSSNIAVEPTGTRFDVYHKETANIVKVTEGQVRVTSVCSGSAPSAELTRGEMTTIAKDHCGETIEVEPMEPTSVHPQAASVEWVVLNGVTVRQASERFNRCNKGRALIPDPTIEKVRVGGSFDCSDMEGFAAALQSLYGARVSHRTAPDGSKIIYLTLATRK